MEEALAGGKVRVQEQATSEEADRLRAYTLQCMETTQGWVQVGARVRVRRLYGTGHFQLTVDGPGTDPSLSVLLFREDLRLLGKLLLQLDDAVSLSDAAV